MTNTELYALLIQITQLRIKKPNTLKKIHSITSNNYIKTVKKVINLFFI